MSQQEISDYRKVFAHTLKMIRMNRGLTQAAMADILSVPASTVGAWEAGVHATPVSRIQKIAGKLGVSTNYLITGQPDTSSSQRGKSSAEMGRANVAQPSEQLVSQVLHDASVSEADAGAEDDELVNVGRTVLRYETPDVKAAQCINHVADYLNEHGSDPDHVSWMLIELKKKFPVSHPSYQQRGRALVKAEPDRGPGAKDLLRKAAESSDPQSPTRPATPESTHSQKGTGDTASPKVRDRN